ncbi:MAG: hypothetical protein K1X67_24835 [Fimbriimonadaceae bacterium]|nr:hypothetical protein [Fimbriimonadaceae bacterium]
MVLSVLSALILAQPVGWTLVPGRFESVSLVGLGTRKPNFNTVLSDDGQAIFLDHSLRFRFGSGESEYLGFEEASDGKHRVRAVPRRDLKDQATSTGCNIQSAPSERVVIVRHYTNLQHNGSGQEVSSRGGVSKVTIGGDWAAPILFAERSQPIAKYFPGMFSLRTLIVRRTPTNTFRIEIREGNKRICEIPVATNPGFVAQFDDQRLRMLARVKTQGVQKFGLDLVNLRPYKRTRLPQYPLTRSLGPVSFLRDGRVLAAFSVKVGNDPKLKDRFPGATDEVIRDVIALYDPKKSKWQKVADGTLWCASASGSVMLVGDENPKGKQWLFWPKVSG